MSEELDALLDSLWETLFARGVAGPVSPRDIRRHGLDRRRVRATELREVARVRHELQALVEGRLVIGDDGRLREAAMDEDVERVQISPVLQRAVAVEDLVRPLNTVRMLSRAQHEQALESVRRELTLQHVAVMAEEEMAQLPLEHRRGGQVDPDWLARWKEGARDVVSVSLKRYWARMLAGEVLRPGTYSVRTVDFFRNISRTDLEMVQIVARFCFQGFIYRNPGRYFSPQLHYPLFQTLEELGILRGVYGRSETWLVHSAVSGHFRAMLPCHGKAIFLEGDDADDDIRLPVFRLSRFGREVFSLCQVEADVAYLGAVAGELKKKGYRVQLGDWSGDGVQGLFTERMAF
jgi:hypothetical protein